MDFLAALQARDWEKSRKAIELIREFKPNPVEFRETIFRFFFKAGLINREENIPEDLKIYQYPALVLVSTGSHCNLRCFFCRDDSHKGTRMSMDVFARSETLIRNAAVIDLTGWSEPFLNPDMETMIRRALEINPDILLEFTTNGTLLGSKIGRLLKNHVYQLVISINAGSQETYDRDMRKSGYFDGFPTRIRAMLAELSPKDCENISLHFVTHLGNMAEMSAYVDLAEACGVKTVRFGYFICSDPQYWTQVVLHEPEKYNQFLAQAMQRGQELGIQVHGTPFGPERPGGACKWPFRVTIIYEDGTIGPCCFAGGHEMAPHLTDQADIWFSDEYNSLRNNLDLPACSRCYITKGINDFRTHFNERVRASSDFKMFERYFKKMGYA